jgi:Lar family restriction alleviation protein
MTPTVENANPCPFCGSTQIIQTWTERDEKLILYCMQCEACGPAALTMDEAIRRWNAAPVAHVGGEAQGQTSLPQLS